MKRSLCRDFSTVGDGETLNYQKKYTVMIDETSKLYRMSVNKTDEMLELDK